MITVINLQPRATGSGVSRYIAPDSDTQQSIVIQGRPLCRSPYKTKLAPHFLLTGHLLTWQAKPLP